MKRNLIFTHHFKERLSERTTKTLEKFETDFENIRDGFKTLSTAFFNGTKIKFPVGDDRCVAHIGKKDIVFITIYKDND
jgi:hypothetical protein